MPFELKRITTEFVESEDRIRLCGELAPNQTVVLWLTQRLLNRLVPHVLAWVEQHTGVSAVSGGVGSDVRADLVNSFAQQAAVASLEQQPPVQAHTAQWAWLVHAVDITVNQQVLQLTFKGQPSTDGSAPAPQARVTMPALPLRQWLAILHGQCRQAGWVSDTPCASGVVWPEWMQAGQDGAGRVAVLH